MFQKSRQGAVQVIAGDQPLTGESSESFRTAIEACIQEATPRVVLDMAGLPLMDSAGLEELLSAQEALEQRAGALKLSSPNPLCRDILHATGVGNQFETYAEVKAAIGSFIQ